MDIKALSPTEILMYIPQQPPFRFIDEIIFVNENEIIGSYLLKHDEGFYQGHFPGKPITPGVILLESMGQVGVVALGYYLLSREISRKQLSNFISLFTDAEVEFFHQTQPGQKLMIHAKKIYWRQKKLRSSIQLFCEDKLIAQAVTSGQGIMK